MRQKIASFLDVYVPENEIFCNESKMIYYDHENVGENIWETPPQLYVQKAVIVESGNGCLAALGTVSINDKMCEGHFSFFKMLPLAVLAQAVSQVGELLVLTLSEEKNEKKIPLVVDCAEVRCITNKGGTKCRKFIVPGDKLLIFVSYIGGKFGIHKIGAKVYVEDGIMAAMKCITYINVDSGYFKGE